MTDKMKFNYVVADPEEFTAFKDQEGLLYVNRDQAIAANFDIDLKKRIMNDPQIYAIISNAVRDIVTQFITRHPDFVRVLQGDRDAT